jgi:ubiquitin-like 1-activating enzyme E1 B
LLTLSSTEPLPDKPIKGTWEGPIVIPTKPKKTPEPEPETNGNGLANGKHPAVEAAADARATGTTKRPHPEDLTELSTSKKAKTAPPDDDVVILDDSAGGAIVIDD